MNSTSREELRQILRPWKRKGIILSLLTALTSVLLVALALVSQRVLDSAMGLDQHLRGWCMVLAALAVGVPILNSVTNAWADSLTDRGVLLLQQISMERLNRKDCAGLEGFHSGAIYSRITGDSQTLCQRYTFLLPATVGQLVRLVTALAALVLLVPLMLGAALAAGAVAAVIAAILRRFLKRRYLAVRASGDGLTSELQESLEHLELRRSAVDPRAGARRLDQRQQRWRRDRMKLRLLNAGGGAAFSMLVQLASGAILVWGGLSIAGGTLTFGGLTALLQLANLFRTPVAGLSGLHSRLAAIDAAQDRLMELWDLPDEPRGESPPDRAVCRGIRFRHVTFAYPGEERPVFQDLNLRIELDRWTCLSGSSGRGKSTLYRLLLGFYRPQEGEILLETDQGCVPCSAATRHLFDLVPQTPVLFSGTLRENLLLARPDATEEDLLQALDCAQCDFVDALPQGMDTHLGQGGEGLSVGQRQRITIARALLSKAQIMLLDECTSALDRETEARLLASLMRRCPAAIAATHRQDALNKMDVYYLDLGKNPNPPNFC